MTPWGSPGRGILGYRMPMSGAKEMWSGTEARWGARRVHLGLEGHVPKAALAGAEMEQNCSFAVGLPPPGKSVFVLACSERAWAGPLPRGLALARHSYRLDTMILTQIPHT